MTKERKYWLKNCRLTLMQGHYGRKIFLLPRLHLWKEKAYRKHFDIGEGLSIGFGTRFYREHGLEGKLTVGDHFTVTNNVVLDYSGELEIGSHVSVSEGVKIYTHDHDYLSDEDTAIPGKVKIGDRVWIGAGAIILSNVTVGEHSVIGAGAVVSHDVPAWVIVAGNPARVVKELSKKDYKFSDPEKG